MNKLVIKKNQEGMTLIELIIVVAMITIISIVLATMFLSQNRIYLSQNAELGVTSAVRSGLDDIDSYVRQGNRVLATYSTFTGGSNVLILQIQSVNSSGRLIAGTFDYVVYSLNGAKVQRQTFADASSARVSGTRVVADNVTNLNFTYNNVDFVQVNEVATSITATLSAGHQNRTFTVDSKARLRDY